MSIRRILLPATIAIGSLEALLLALEAAFADALSTVVVVHGTVERFCGGMDLSAMVREDARVGLQLFARVLHRLQEANKPTIAAVEGPAIGGGVGIAAACDVVVASSTATFALPEALFGLLPGAVLPVLLDRMRPQKARLLALLGRSHAADWAEINGLVDEVASPSDIEACGSWSCQGFWRAWHRSAYVHFEAGFTLSLRFRQHRPWNAARRSRPVS